jgi:hypothetical protein
MVVGGENAPMKYSVWPKKISLKIKKLGRLCELDAMDQSLRSYFLSKSDCGSVGVPRPFTLQAQ